MIKLADLPIDARILIVLMGSVGDVTRALPVAVNLKRAKPQAKISWLVEPRSYDLLSSHAAIDRVIKFERQEGLVAILNLYKKLKAQSFDLVLDLQRHFKSGLFSLLSASSRRLGFHPRNCKEFNWLFNSEYVPYRPESVAKLQHYLEFVRYLGVEQPVSDAELQVDMLRSDRFNLPQNYIVLVLGSNWSSKDWPISGYLQLMRLILERRSYSIVLCADRSKQQMASDLSTACDSKRVLNLCGQTTLTELMAVIKAAKACVGPDSGPAHIAAALQTPYVTLFGPTDARRVAALGMQKYIVRSSIGCSPCGRRVCPGLDKLCMRLLSAEAAFEKLDLALGH